MNALFIGHSGNLAQGISLVLKVRWPDLNLIHIHEPAESLEFVHREEPDIVMLHLAGREAAQVSGREAEPVIDYFELIAQIRSCSSVPVIVVSESDDVMERVKALETGADDWLPSSFIPLEFIARVNAILRRCRQSREGIASFLNGRLVIDYAAHEVFLSGRPVNLTPIQYRILSHLLRNEGRVCTRAELLRHVWGPNYGDDPQIVKRSVHRLRSRIEEDPSNPEIINNSRGVGYVIHATDSKR